jgi:protein KRI1
MLSDDDFNSSGNEIIHQITVNEHFAKAYKHKKEREELQHCKLLTFHINFETQLTQFQLPSVKEKYGSDAELDDETDSEEDESEDEDGEELTPAMDVAMLRTLAMIRSKNPAIYDSAKNVFEGAVGDFLPGTKISSRHEPR